MHHIPLGARPRSRAPVGAVAPGTTGQTPGGLAAPHSREQTERAVDPAGLLHAYLRVPHRDDGRAPAGGLPAKLFSSIPNQPRWGVAIHPDRVCARRCDASPRVSPVHRLEFMAQNSQVITRVRGVYPRHSSPVQNDVFRFPILGVCRLVLARCNMRAEHIFPVRIQDPVPTEQSRCFTPDFATNRRIRQVPCCGRYLRHTDAQSAEGVMLGSSVHRPAQHRHRQLDLCRDRLYLHLVECRTERCDDVSLLRMRRQDAMAMAIDEPLEDAIPLAHDGACLLLHGSRLDYLEHAAVLCVVYVAEAS